MKSSSASLGLCFVLATSAALQLPGATRHWAGAAPGGNRLWSAAANWSNNIVPAPGDHLNFPVGADAMATTNDLPAATVFSGFTIVAEQVVLHGNEVSLSNATVGAGTGTRANLRLPLRPLDGIVWSVQTGGQLTLEGPVTAAQSSLKTGPGTLELAGTNQFGTTFQIDQGTVRVRDSRALLPRTVPVTVMAGAQVELTNSCVVSNSLTLSGTLAATGDGASNVWSGGMSVPSAGILHTAPNCILRLGDFFGSGSLTKSGLGRVILATPGCVNYTGTLFVNEGTVTVPGCVSGGRFVIASGATLEGTGSVNILTNRAGGRLRPGQGSTPGTLTMLGAFELGSGSIFHVRLNGTALGSQYSSLASFNSPAVLNGASLELSLGFVPATNLTFRLITRSSPVTGTFAGLPQGALLTNNGVVFRISYNGGTGNDVTLLSLGYTGPTNLRIHDGPSTRRVALRWNGPNFAPPVREYIVFRDGFEANRLDPLNFGALGPFFEELHMLPGHTYTYQVVAVFNDGSHSVPSNPLTVTALAAPPIVGTNQVVTVLLRFADFIEEPFPTSQVDTMMFDATNSVRAYLEEVSYGQFTIVGSTHGWFTMPRPASNYCATLFPNGLWYSCNGLLADIYSVLPPAVSNLVQSADRVQFAVHGMGTVGEAGGSVAFYSATNGFGPGTIIHELGHTFGFLHASTLISCTGYPLGPDLVHLRTNNCFTLLYGDRYDPMGGGATVHYNAFFKEQAGWLPGNRIQSITADGNYTLRAVEVPASNAVQMLKIDLGGEMFWFLEYRTATGFDGPNSPDPPGGGPIDGVVVRLRVSRYILADWDTFWIQPVVRTDSPWFDPFSGLCVNVVAQDGTNATVRITGLNYSFRFTDVRRLGNDTRLSWDAVPGARYVLQGSVDFGSWTTLATSVDATNRAMTFTLPGTGAGPYRFFRAAVDTGP